MRIWNQTPYASPSSDRTRKAAPYCVLRWMPLFLTESWCDGVTGAGSTEWHIARG